MYASIIYDSSDQHGLRYDGHRELGRFRAEVDSGLQVVEERMVAQSSTMYVLSC